MEHTFLLQGQEISSLLASSFLTSSSFPTAAGGKQTADHTNDLIYLFWSYALCDPLLHSGGYIKIWQPLTNFPQENNYLQAPLFPVKDKEIGGNLKVRVKCANTWWQVEIHRNFFVSNEQMTTDKQDKQEKHI